MVWVMIWSVCFLVEALVSPVSFSPGTSSSPAIDDNDNDDDDIFQS